jgi:hypothetical protein
MTEQAGKIHHDNAPAHSTALVQAFLAKHHITQLCDFWFFPKLKSPLKVRKFVNVKVTQYTS